MNEFFYILILWYLVSTCLLISSRSLVISVFLVISIFLSGVFLFAFLQAEYLMVTFLIVYLGAVIVLFLFVVMLLKVQEEIISSHIEKLYLVSLSFFFFILFVFFYFCVLSLVPTNTFSVIFFLQNNEYMQYFALTNLEKIGLSLFSEFSFILVISAFLMFICILGSLLIIYKK